MMSKRTYGWKYGLGLAALATALTLGMGSAQAQEEGADTVSGTGKGIVGGALLGAEVVMIVEAIAGIEEVWPYPVFGGLGAVGGAIGGCYMEGTCGGEGSPEGSLYFLAGGMALVIPTLVAVLNVTAYDPMEEGADEADGEGEGEGEDGEPAAPAVDADANVQTGRAKVVPALLGVGPRGVSLGIPTVEIHNSYSVHEMAQFGLEQEMELRVPVVRGSF